MERLKDGVFICFFVEMVTLMFVVVLVLSFPLFFASSYIGELMISFLPYIVIIAFVFSLVSLVNFRKRMRPGCGDRYRAFRGIAFVVFCGMFFLYSKKFNAFYTTEPLSQQSASGGITVLFANMYKNNTSYEPIQALITEHNPDILMFVEFAHHHYQQLEEFIKEHYPYTNNISRSKTFIGSMVFSKYPIKNKTHEFPQGAWRYGYFSVPYQGKDIYFYLVHTSSPDRSDHFFMRNEQLQTFVDDFALHASKRTHDALVVAGDFNITPWSYYYSILTDVFSGTLTNITSRIPFLLSRRLKEFPLFQAHIDHIRTSNSLDISHLRALTIPGSDHKGFLFTIQM